MIEPKNAISRVVDEDFALDLSYKQQKLLKNNKLIIWCFGCQTYHLYGSKSGYDGMAFDAQGKLSDYKIINTSVLVYRLKLFIISNVLLNGY